MDAVGARFVGCSALEAGGAVAVEGQGSVANLVESLVEGSLAGTSGGGVAVLSGGVLVMDGCVLRDNVAGETGGGLWVDSRPGVVLATVRNTTLSGNVARVGGGLSVTTEVLAASVAGAASAALVPDSTDDTGGATMGVALDLVVYGL